MTSLVQLGDSAGARFTFEVVRYQYSPSGNRVLRYFDLNWLVCRFTVSEAGIYRRSGSILVFTTELVDLAEWLDAIGNGRCASRCFGFHDPGFVLKLGSVHEEHPGISVLFGDCSGDRGTDPDTHMISMALDPEAFDRVKRDVREMIVAFPERHEGLPFRL